MTDWFERHAPVDDPAVRDQVMAMFAAVGRQPLSGNRESWSELVIVDGAYLRRSGDHHASQVHVETISAEAAWQALRRRAMEGLGLYSVSEQAAARPEAILAYYHDIWGRNTEG